MADHERFELKVRESLGLLPEAQEIDLSDFSIFQIRFYDMLVRENYSRLFAYRKAQDLSPFLAQLTAPRSISEHRDLITASLAVMPAYKTGDDYSNIYHLSSVLDEFSVYQCEIVASTDVENGVTTPEQWWQDRKEAGLEGVCIPPDEKIVNLNQLTTRLKDLKSTDGSINVGALTGKWRIGPHSEQLETIEEAKKLLGPRSVLILFLEGKDSVELRKGENHACLDDMERAKRFKDNKWVDFICVLDPQTGSDAEMKDYYKDVWKRVGLDYYFLGAKDHPLTPRFCEYGRELGTIVLWSREQNRMSTTDIVKDLQGKR